MYDDDFQRLLDDNAGGGAEVAIVVRHPDGTETQALVAKDASVVMESATEDTYSMRPVTRPDHRRTVHQIRVTTLGQVTLYSPEFFTRGGRPEIEPGHLDRAAAIMGGCCAHCDDLVDERLALLDEAGMLVTPERDAAVAALPLPGDGCSCTPHEQSAGGVYTEYLLEYEPDCPEHSEHLWDPRQGVWVLRSERDAAVAAKALREAADVLEGGMTAHDPDVIAFGRRPAIAILRDRADRIEREAGESNADA